MERSFPLGWPGLIEKCCPILQLLDPDGPTDRL